MHERIKDTQRAGLLSALCVALYCAQYLGRYCLSACISSMVEGNFFTKTELGTVATCFFIAYAVMQLPGGILGDRLRASRLAGFCITGSALIVFSFAFVKDIRIMRVLWFVNGLLQAPVWPSLLHILADVNTQSEDQAKPLISVVTLSIAIPAGVLSSYGLCALVLRFATYRYCFLLSSFLMVIIVSCWFLFAAPMLKKDVGSDCAETKKETAKKANEFWKQIMLASIPMVLLASFFHGLLKDGLTTWIPTYLTETLNLSADSSLLLTTLLPFVNFGGVYVADFINRKIFKNEMAASACCFALTLLVLGAMVLFFPQSVIGTVICFCLVSLLMTSVNTLLISFMPLYFGRLSIVSTISGLMDALIYVGTAFSTTIFALAAENFGWNGTRVLWCIIAAVGILVCVIPVKKWGKYRENN